MPGKDSFTTAVIFALEALVEDSTDGRFTTVELLNKIKSDAPHFPSDQVPILVNREKKHAVGRIMLHPLQREGSEDQSSRKAAANLDLLNRHTLTLHFDFGEKPSQTYVETLGREFNVFFHHNSGVNRVRWGGIRQSMVARAAEGFKAGLEQRKRRASMNLQQTSSSEGSSQLRLAESSRDPLTPASMDPHSPRTTYPAGDDSSDFHPPDGAISLPRTINSNDESEGSFSGGRNRRKRRRSH